MPELEAPTDFITMARASEISGVAAITLSGQACVGRLQRVKVGRRLVTTRIWLHEYLMSCLTRQGRRKPLTADYVAPDDTPHPAHTGRAGAEG